MHSGLGHKEVKVIDGNTVIDLGLLSSEECLALARKLESVADDLAPLDQRESE